MSGAERWDQAVGRRIRRSRIAAGMSMDELGQAVGATAGAVSHWETGRFLPRRERQIVIARALGVPWIELFGLVSELDD